jgi:hypothetical protein
VNTWHHNLQLSLEAEIVRAVQSHRTEMSATYGVEAVRAACLWIGCPEACVKPGTADLERVVDQMLEVGEVGVAELAGRLAAALRSGVGFAALYDYCK